MKVVILTTIYVAEGLYKIKERCPGWVPIVAGDLKTPHDANKQICKEIGGLYLDPQTQMKLGFTHAAAVPWNCYARKNIAYLFALKEGAELFYTVDDDNVPLEDWAEHVRFGQQECTIISSESGWYDSYREAKTEDGCSITPRGYPWWLIGKGQKYSTKKGVENIGVIAGFPLGSPDVDAMTRMVKNPTVVGYPAQDVVLDKGTMCPYDTQNTIIVRELMPANMLWSQSCIEPYSYGLMRFDDIIPGYIGQVIAWKYGYRVRHGRPFTFQKRNPHNNLSDLRAEIEGMRFQQQLIKTLLEVKLTGACPAEDFRLAVYALLDAIVELPRCMRTYVDTWVSDLASLGMC